MLRCFILFSPFSLLHVVYGLQNITIDDTSSMIQYFGPWEPTAQSNFDYGPGVQKHKLVENDPGATAIFTFTGVGVYYLSPLWPYKVTTAISLDSGPITALDLTDPNPPPNAGTSETVQSQPIWGRSGLSNTQHTVVVSVVPGDLYAVVDGFIYTVDDSNTSSSLSPTLSSSSTTAATSSIPTASPTNSGSSGSTSTNHTLAIAVGAACGGVAIAVLIGLFMFCCQRRARRQSEMTQWAGTGGSNVYPGPAPLATQTTPHSSAPPSLYSNKTFATTPYHPTDSPQGYNPWLYPAPGQSPVQHGSASSRYQANTLSTITESSQSPYGGIASLPHSPANTPGEFGRLSGADQLSVVGESRPTSSYQSSQFTTPREITTSNAGGKQLLTYGRPEAATPAPPPAYGQF